MSEIDGAGGPVASIEGLRVVLASSGDEVVDEISLSIRPGEIVGLVGESGSGKSTVGMSLLAHYRRGAAPSAGRVVVDGADLGALGPEALRSLRGATVAYVPQDPAAALNPALRIGRHLAEAIEVHDPSATRAEVDARIATVMRQVNLRDDAAFLRRYPHQLSGGQQQRVCIALAIVMKPLVLVLDEPTTGLDVSTQSRILETVRNLCHEFRIAALYVSHDLAVVSQIADRIVVMYGGRIVEHGPADEVFAGARHPYTRALLRAVPDIGTSRALEAIPGYAALPGHRPPGCAFHPRCAFAQTECRHGRIEIEERAAGHWVRCVLSELPAVDPPPVRAQRDLDTSTPLLRAIDVRASYGKFEVLRGVSFDIGRGECVALVGESGSGKSTLSRCLIGLHSSYAGEFEFEGRPLAPRAASRTTELRRRLQYVFQSPYSSLNQLRPVGDSIGRAHAVFYGNDSKQRARAVAEALERVGLGESAARLYPDDLSGGERQRVAIARALVAHPDLLICDEITSALDVSVQAAIVDLLDQLRRHGDLAVLFVTHNLALVRSIADRVMVLDRGAVAEIGPTESVLGNPQVEYTAQLLADTPSLRHSGV